jgi:DNA-binding Xre family transcriptional regulator
MEQQMKFSKAELEIFQSLEELENEVFTSSERKSLIKKAEYRSKLRRALAEDVSRELASYMAKEKIGFNELTRRLSVSPATTSKLMRGSGNITLETIAQIAELLGKQPVIGFR